MRIEFVPKVLAVIADVDILSLKRGQTDVDPAVCVHLKVTQSNHTLHMLDKSLDRDIELIAAEPVNQGTLDDGADDKQLTPAKALEKAAGG